MRGAGGKEEGRRNRTRTGILRRFSPSADPGVEFRGFRFWSRDKPARVGPFWRGREWWSRLPLRRVVMFGIMSGMSEDIHSLVGREFMHFKGRRYRLEGFAKDSETLEEMVVYRALYGEGGLWVRPAKMFFETIERDGKSMKRFELI